MAIIVLEDQVYRVTDKLYTRLRELWNLGQEDDPGSELWKICDEIIDRKKGKFIGYIQFHWQR